MSGVYSLCCFIDPLSPPSILHQLLSSFSPVVSLHFPPLCFTSSRRFSLSCFCSWHIQSLWPTRSLSKSFFICFISCFPPLLFSFSSFIWILLCLTWAPLLRVAPQVSSADELKLFVVGGAELFLFLLLSLVGLRSDTLSGPGALLKETVVVFIAERHGWTQRRRRWIESEADAAVWSCIQKLSSVPQCYMLLT